MARKRMISPEIWESQNFSQLSDLAKIVFISLFSHADDEGRGRADPTYIKSSTFPYDENRRVADIKFALSEIARSMSVQFYSVNGIEFYFMTSWERWQKIDKPSKSKFPPPPIVGVGGELHSTEKFDDNSANDSRIVDESSATNTIQNKQSDVYSKDNITYLTRTREEWMDIINKSQGGLELTQGACIASLGDDELYNTVLNTLLDVLVAGVDIKVGDKVVTYTDIAHAVENMCRNTISEIINAFCKPNNETRTIEKKQVSNPANYIVTILMAKNKCQEDI